MSYFQLINCRCVRLNELRGRYEAKGHFFKSGEDGIAAGDSAESSDGELEQSHNVYERLREGQIGSERVLGSDGVYHDPFS